MRSAILLFATALATSRACSRCNGNHGAVVASSPLPTPGSSPSWLSTVRTHAHTRLSPPDHYCNATTGHCDAVFNQTAALFASIGVKAFVRHTHLGSDLNWWPRGPLAAQEAIVRTSGRILPLEFARDAHAHGQHLIAYHYPRCHAYYSKAEPSWLNRDYQGRPVENPRGLGLCINGPWGQEYVDQVSQLVDFGVDGLYTDEFPAPPTGCWCEHCKALYRNYSGGEELPQPTSAEEYRKVLEFNTWSVQRFFTRVAAALAERSAAGIAAGNRSVPAVPFFSTHSLPCADNNRELFETLRLVASGSVVSPKIEFDTGSSVNCLGAFKDPALEQPSLDALIAWGWVSSRDAASGRLPHTWFPNSGDGEPFLACSQAGMLAYGLVANPDHKEADIPNATLFNATYALSAKLEPVLAGTESRRWATVVFPSAARNLRVQLASSGPGAKWGNDTAVWTEVMLPVVGAFEQLMAAMVPLGVALDWQLEAVPTSDGASAVPPGLGFGRPRVVVVTPGAGLSPSQAAGLAAFRSSGGAVVNASQWGGPMAWATAGQRRALGKALLDAAVAAAGPPPFRVSAASGQPHGQVLAVPGQEGTRNVVMVAESFAWCGARRKSPAPPTPSTGVVVEVALASGASASDIVAVDALSGAALSVTSGAAGTARVAVPNPRSLSVVEITCHSGGACMQA